MLLLILYIYITSFQLNFPDQWQPRPDASSNFSRHCHGSFFVIQIGPSSRLLLVVVNPLGSITKMAILVYHSQLKYSHCTVYAG